ncbi:MAG: hypothetical protein H6613_06885 [Ignavibacteriales bacterium]|nr:hypothetical protein [Ignavibacteriales bacterium]
MGQQFHLFYKHHQGNGAYWDTPTHTDIHKIVYAPSNANIMYLGCDGGIYKSTDGGTTWINKNNDINTLQFYNVASDPETKIFYLVGLKIMEISALLIKVQLIGF